MVHHITVYFALLFTVIISLSGCEPTKKEGEDDSTNKVREDSAEKPIEQEELKLVFEDISFFIEDTDKLKDIAEQIFRARYEIRTDQSLSDAGYAFENDRFALANKITLDLLKPV